MERESFIDLQVKKKFFRIKKIEKWSQGNLRLGIVSPAPNIRMSDNKC